MKIVIGLIIIFILIYSCQTEDNKNIKYTLSHINEVNKLELITRNDKCGEWGGDETKLIVYREDLTGPLYADYLEKTACFDGSKPKIIKSIKRIKVNEEEKKLIIESITELCEKKLNKQDIPSHSGRFNQIMLSDSSILISDFPSVELKNFKELSEKIKQN